MLRTIGAATAAAVLFTAPNVVAARSAPSGFDPARSQAVGTLPARIIVLNEQLRSQWNYGGMAGAGDALVQQAISNSIANAGAGVPMYAGVAAGALGGAVAGVMIDANLRHQAIQEVRRADAVFEQGRCRLDLGAPLAGAIERAIAATSWGAALQPQRVPLAPGQRIDQLVADVPERQQFVISYSMSPDYAYLMSTVTASTYATSLKAADARAADPAWFDEIVVASDPMPLAPKTPDDIAAAVAEENARYAATGAPELVRAANTGDTDARRKAVTLERQHRAALKEARGSQWSKGEAAQQRARLWAADGCARLQAAADQQVRDVEAVFGRLFRGEMPARVTGGWRPMLPTPLSGTERVVESRADSIYLLGRGGTSPNLWLRYSWLPPGSVD